MEYIEREKAIDEIDKWLDSVGYVTVGKGLTSYGELIGCLEDTPAADVVEVRHGEWVMRGGRFRCSECDGKALMQDVGGTGGFSHEFEQVKSDICPHCGAKMDGKDGE